MLQWRISARTGWSCANGRLERYLQDGDTVAVQGRRLDFPSFVVIKEQLAELTGTIADKARHDAWVQRINVGFLLINALVLCLLWL